MSHDRQYQSKQLAKILGISTRTLYRMLSDGRIPEPASRTLKGYRNWSAEEVREIQGNPALAKYLVDKGNNVSGV